MDLHKDIGGPINTNMINERIKKEFLRFASVGVIATAIHYFIYWFLLRLIHPTVAYSIGYVVSFVCNFYLTSKFTFQKKATVKKGLGFISSHAFNYLLQVSLLSFFIHVGVDRLLAPFPVYCICIPVNFLLVRFVFHKFN